MRRINKGKPFQDFENFKREKCPNSWDDFESEPEIRSNTRKYILENEQQLLCGYTELPITFEPTSSHIDHFRRKSAEFFPELTFEWNNLIVSCCSDDFGGRYKDLTYLKGKSKKAYNNILNPVIENPHDYFEYTEWGQIIPKSGLNTAMILKATETIEAFKLTHESLRTRRYAMIENTKTYKSDFSLNEIKEYLKEDGFISVIEQFVNN